MSMGSPGSFASSQGDPGAFLGPLSVAQESRPPDALSDTAIRAAKPGPKAVKLADEKGLFLMIAPSGGKLWRLKYRFGGKEKKLAFGSYPDSQGSSPSPRRSKSTAGFRHRSFRN
jgi:hypothetical protein